LSTRRGPPLRADAAFRCPKGAIDRPACRPVTRRGPVAFVLGAALAGMLGCHARACGRQAERERMRASEALDLAGGVDCPDGLLRCAGGVVMASEIGYVPHDCQGTESRCTCPWERALECHAGCVRDDLLVVGERDAAAQLCAPRGRVIDAGTPPSDPCGSGYRCDGGVVTGCAIGDSGVMVRAHCQAGCAPGTYRVDAVVGVDIAALVLCAR